MLDQSVRYDVFVSYNTRDRAAAEALAQRLEQRELKPFLDRWHLPRGVPWIRELETLVGSKCQSMAVLIGSEGFGNWHQRERELALFRQASDPSFRVIPVLLSGSDPGLNFLSLNTWIDLRDVDNASEFAALVAAIRGEQPDVAARQRADMLRSQINPFRGLRPFREEDARFFFGRDAAVADLARAVTHSTFVGVVGASGSGKSSVVRAGLVPRLRLQREPGAPTWEIVTITPGEQPLTNFAFELVPLLIPGLDIIDRRRRANELVRDWIEGKTLLGQTVDDALPPQPENCRLLLVVDQWEELYTPANDTGLDGKKQRHAFVEQLLAATARHTPNFQVVLTLRGDFYGHAVAHRGLSDRLQHSVVNVGPMTRNELRTAIVEPARKVGLGFADGLIELILDDVGNEPASLPLLEFVLEILWDRRRSGSVSTEEYMAIGRVQGAIATRAEQTLERLIERRSDNESMARNLFVKLVHSLEGVPDTRARVSMATMEPGSRNVLDAFVLARLLVVSHEEVSGEDIVEIGHEALITRWSRLRGWLDADREFLRVRGRLRAAASIWTAEREPPSRLLPPGLPLDEAKNLRALRPDWFDPPTNRYLDLSVEAAEERQRSERRARDEVRTVESRLLANVAEQQVNLGKVEVGILLALKALPSRMGDVEGRPYVPQAERALFAAAQAVLARVVLRGHEGEVTSAIFSPDGKRIVTACPAEHAARLWDALTGETLAVLSAHAGKVRTAEFSPDGSRIVTASDDGTARVWDAASGTSLETLEGHRGFVQSAVFSRDGGRIATASHDRTARLWDAGTYIEQAVLRGHSGSISRALFSSDGTRLVTVSSDGTVRTWDTGSHKALATLAGHKDSVQSAQFSPDGSRIVTASKDRTVRVWDALSGMELMVLERPSSGEQLATDQARLAATYAAFSPDGARVFTTYGDGNALLWDAVSGTWLSKFRGHTLGITSAEFSSDGSRLVTASFDGTARLWDTSTGSSIGVLQAHPGVVRSVVFSPDGTKVATASVDHTANVWRVFRNTQDLIDFALTHPSSQLTTIDLSDLDK